MGSSFHPDGLKSIDLNRRPQNIFAACRRGWQYKPMFFRKLDCRGHVAAFRDKDNDGNRHYRQWQGAQRQ
jgi:hypothetical protein